MVGTKLAMGAKEAQVTRDLCETLRKTGASAEITCTTMHGALKKVVTKNDCDIMKDVGRAVVEDGNYPSKCDTYWFDLWIYISINILYMEMFILIYILSIFSRRCNQGNDRSMLKYS